MKWNQTMEQTEILTQQRLAVTVAPTFEWGLSKKLKPGMLQYKAALLPYN